MKAFYTGSLLLLFISSQAPASYHSLPARPVTDLEAQKFLGSVVILQPHYCSGVLLQAPGENTSHSSRWVLTAAHCIRSALQTRSSVAVASSQVYQPENLPFRMGAYGAFLRKQAARSPFLAQAVRAWAPARALDALSARNNETLPIYAVEADFGLLELDHPIKGKGLALHNEDLDSLKARGFRIFSAGYGSRNDGAPRDDLQLRYFAVTDEHSVTRTDLLSLLPDMQERLRSNFAYELFSGAFNIHWLLALAPNGHVLPQICAGDSGGPLLAVKGKEVYVVGNLSSAVDFLGVNHPCGAVSAFARPPSSVSGIQNYYDISTQDLKH